MKDPKEKDFQEREFFNTFEWTYTIEHPKTSDETAVVIFADTYDESVKKLKDLGLPYDLKKWHLESCINFEPNLNSYIYTEVKEDEKDNS